MDVVNFSFRPAKPISRKMTWFTSKSPIIEKEIIFHLHNFGFKMWIFPGYMSKILSLQGCPGLESCPWLSLDVPNWFVQLKIYSGNGEHQIQAASIVLQPLRFLISVRSVDHGQRPHPLALHGALNSFEGSWFETCPFWNSSATHVNGCHVYTRWN